MTERDAKAVAARAGVLARARFESGANCAEAVLHAVPEALGDSALRLPESAGMGWTAGIGESGCLCGALAAAVMLEGAASDARPGGPAAKRRRAVTASAGIRTAFVDEFGSTCCRAIRRGMEPGSPACREHCAGISARTAELVTASLAASAAVPETRVFAARDALYVGRNALPPLVALTAGLAIALAVTGAIPSMEQSFIAAAVILALSAAWGVARTLGRAP